jgi:hypothetical protein
MAFISAWPQQNGFLYLINTHIKQTNLIDI